MKKKTNLICFLLVLLGITPLLGFASYASYTKADKAIDRIGPEETRQLVESGQALLVCSYDDDSCKSKLFDGALLKSELDLLAASLPKDQKIIFYCG